MPRRSPIRVKWMPAASVVKPGHYWIDSPRHREPYIDKVRYDGEELAIGNCRISGGYDNCLFNGPLLQPPTAPRRDINA